MLSFVHTWESLNLTTAAGVGKLMITEHCKIEINTFVSFPNGLLLDRYSWLYLSHLVNINKVEKNGYIYIKALETRLLLMQVLSNNML